METLCKRPILMVIGITHAILCVDFLGAQEPDIAKILAIPSRYGLSPVIYARETRAGREILSVNLRGTDANDADLSLLKGFGGLKTLAVGGTKITDSGLAKIKAHIGLTELDLSNDSITDAGVAQLSDLRHLAVQRVFLS